MKLMRSDQPEYFNVRARHSTLYPVDLPEFLPIEQVQQMVMKFQEILCKQLDIMLDTQVTVQSTSSNHCHTSSGESMSGLSVGTNKSGKTDLLQGSQPEPFEAARIM